ncbi:hypothetical protein GQX74_002365 [Glossina fuscipes]|nr:hypothetical protein GQX74_002365 [Glossina fuscipes]
MYKENKINNSEPGKFLCSGHSGANGNTLLNCNRTHKAATSRITTAATTTTTTTIKITTITLFIYATRALATIKQDFFLIESLYGAHSTKLCYKTVTALSDVVNDDDDGDDAAITSTILKTIRFNYKNVYGHSIISAIVPVLIDRQVDSSSHHAKKHY